MGQRVRAKALQVRNQVKYGEEVAEISDFR